MDITKRGFLLGGTSLVITAASSSAHALSQREATDHVQKTLNDIVKLLRQSGNGESRAPQLQNIMETRANVPLLARFSAGRAWREMSKSQQTSYTQAFSRYIAVTYSRRFDEYAGDPKVSIGRAIDAGKKGFLVESPISSGDSEPIAVEWLVSDRGGRVEIVDLVIEGISMAATQREEINAMLDRRNGDVDKLIAHLNTAP